MLPEEAPVAPLNPIGPNVPLGPCGTHCDAGFTLAEPKAVHRLAQVRPNASQVIVGVGV
jgi:hypothetical protein